MADRATMPRSWVSEPWPAGPRLPWLAFALPPIVVAIVLVLMLAADPAARITTSNGIRTDEAWDVINARNLVLLGRWSTDDWNLTSSTFRTAS